MLSPASVIVVRHVCLAKAIFKDLILLIKLNKDTPAANEAISQLHTKPFLRN